MVKEIDCMIPCEEMTQPLTSPQVGSDALQVLQYIAAKHKLDELTFFSHHVGINWRQQYSDDTKADHLYDCFTHNDNEKRLSVALHDWQSISRLTAADLMRNAAPHEVHSVTSQVRRGTQVLHIPMMNFHPEVDHGEEFIRECLGYLRKSRPELVPPGVLLASGRYFHYYGFELLPDSALSQFLSYFLMPSILVSPRYIGHALYEKECSLRLTADSTYKPTIPTVIAHID